MATRRSIPIAKVVPRTDPRAAKLKEAAETSPAANAEPTMTHQGPGTGKAAAADPEARSAILSGKSPTVASNSGAKTAQVESAAEEVRQRAVESELKVPGADERSSTSREPHLPGNQAADGGTATTGPSAPAGGSGGAYEGGGPGTSATAAPEERLDAALAGALDKLDDASPPLRGGLDVFGSVGAGTPASGVTSSTSGAPLDIGDPGRPSTGSDGGAEHAENVVGQVTGGRGSAETMFGDRLESGKAELGLMEALLGDATARETSPGVAVGDGPIVRRALELAEKAADGDDDAYRKLETLATEMHKDSGGASAPSTGIGYGVQSNADGEVVAPSGAKTPAEDNPFWKAVTGMFMGTRDLAGNETALGEAHRNAENDIKNPGGPNNPDAPPTPAQLAFRDAIRKALGADRGGSGDIDPADTGGVVTGGSKFPDAANNNTDLIGRPAGPGETGHTGTIHTGTGGTDVDPVEGSAYSGPALGGNPEDLQFGSATLPLDSARRSASGEEGDDEDEEDDSDQE